MASIKPKFIISIDWETSGASWVSLEESVRLYQGLAVGAAIADIDTFEIIDSIYEEIQFDETTYQWSPDAEKIHRLSRAHLKANGVTQEQAAVSLGTLIQKYFADTPIYIAGHNVQFDIMFTRQLMSKFGLELNISHRSIDTSSIGFALFNISKSDELYEYLGLPARTQHNALEDAVYTVETLKSIRTIFNAALNP